MVLIHGFLVFNSGRVLPEESGNAVYRIFDILNDLVADRVFSVKFDSDLASLSERSWSDFDQFLEALEFIFRFY